MQRNFGISRGVGTAGRSSNELRMQKLAHNCRFPCSPIFRVSWHGRKGRGKLVETFESFPDSCSQRQRFLGEILINHPGNWSLSYRVINSGKTRGKGRRSKMTIDRRKRFRGRWVLENRCYKHEGGTLLNWHVNTSTKGLSFPVREVVLHHPLGEREGADEEGKLQRRNVEAGRTPFVLPEIFPCVLIAGKESSRPSDDADDATTTRERCSVVYCKSKERTVVPMNGTPDTRNDRSRQTDEITAERSIIECLPNDDKTGKKKGTRQGKNFVQPKGTPSFPAFSLFYRPVHLHRLRCTFARLSVSNFRFL